MAEKAWEKKERASSDQPHLQHQDDVAASRFFDSELETNMWLLAPLFCVTVEPLYLNLRNKATPLIGALPE